MQAIPHGVLCFLSSYGLMNKLMKHFKESGLGSQLRALKHVFWEPQRSDDFEHVLQEYRAACKISGIRARYRREAAAAAASGDNSASDPVDQVAASVDRLRRQQDFGPDYDAADSEECVIEVKAIVDSIDGPKKGKPDRRPKHKKGKRRGIGLQLQARHEYERLAGPQDGAIMFAVRCSACCHGGSGLQGYKRTQGPVTTWPM